jgi:tetratricopeptide (TPR) repeat protein
MGNLKGYVEQLKGSLETMAIGVGSMVLPALTEMAGGATQAVNVLAGLPSSTQATALAFGAISIAAPAAVKAVQSLTAAFQALRTGSASLGMSLSGIGLAIGGVAVAADLILQKTSGHGLFEWLFGDVAGAERNARAAAELEARIRAAGQGADAVAISMQHLREKTDAWAAAQAELNRIQQEGLPLYQQNAAVQAAAQAMTEAEASVRAAAQAMKDHNVDALEMARVYNDLPPKLRAVFDEVTGITQVMGTQEFAMRSAATVTDGWRSSVEGALKAAQEQTPKTTNEFRNLGRSMEELGGSADKAIKALKEWGKALADNDPTYEANAFMLAALGEELADLKAKGDDLTAAERERMQVLEGMIQKLGDQQSAMEDNKKALEGMLPVLVKQSPHPWG